jgi:hypothetical protein
MVGHALNTLGYELDVIHAKKTRHAGGFVGVIG